MSKMVQYEVLFEGRWVEVVDWFGGRFDAFKTLEELKVKRGLNAKNCRNLVVC